MLKLRPHLLISVIVGSGLFFLFGEWLSDVLIDYGLTIFVEPSILQKIAMAMAVALQLPGGLFFESWPIPRWCMAMNGALWGAIVYAVCTGVAAMRRARTKSRSRNE